LNVQKSLFLSDFLLLKHLWTHKRFFLSLRATFFSTSSNINAIAAYCLLGNEWSCMFDGNYRRPPITCCSGRWLNTTNSVNTDRSDGTVTWRIVWTCSMRNVHNVARVTWHSMFNNRYDNFAVFVRQHVQALLRTRGWRVNVAGRRFEHFK
jgi:hypothetical protein